MAVRVDAKEAGDQESVLQSSRHKDGFDGKMNFASFELMKLRLLIAALVFALAAAKSQAVSLTVTNPGFENITGQTVFNEFTFGTPTGWSLYNPFNIVNQSTVYTGTLQPNGVQFFPVPAPQGSRIAIFYNSGSKGAGVYGFQQTLADTLQANTQYTLTVQVGNIASGTSQNNTFYDLSNFPGYRVDLLANGVPIVSDINSLSIGEGAWATSTVTFTTGPTVTPSQNLGIRISNLNATNGTPDNEVDFDDVQLTAVSVPEPGTWALLLVSVSACWLFRACRIARRPAKS